MKKIIGMLMACIILISGFSLPVSAENDTADSLMTTVFSKENTYSKYLEKFNDVSSATSDLTVAASEYISASDDAGISVSDFGDEKDVLIWKEIGGSAEWKISVPQSALYCIELTYFVTNPEARNVELGLYIDGELPFDTAANIVLPRLFRNKTGIETDERGNDIRPIQEPLDVWISNTLKDNAGVYNSPYGFYLSEGEHTLKFEGVRAGFAIKSIRLYGEKELISYKEYSAGASLADAVPQYIQGEEAAWQTDSVLYPMYDRSGPDTVPSDPVKLKLNTVGQSNWAMHGQAVTWKVTVAESGYYRIGVRFNQNLARNLISYRRLYINGEVPFKEADCISFPFSDKWQTAVLGDGWLFRLDKGENTITFEAIPGKVGDVISKLEDITYTMNTVYRKIIMITGVDPDPNRDYKLEKEIPGLTDSFESIKTSCEEATAMLTELNGRSTAASTSALNTVIVQMKSFIKKKDTVAVRVSQLKDNISSLSALIISLKNQPLEIDYLTVGSGNLFPKKHSFFENLFFGIKSFVGSFTEDYNSIGKKYEGLEPVNVWINSGRDQAQIIKNMADSMFTPETGIPVNINLVQQSLVQATLSDKCPDTVIFVGASDPVNLAARNALQDLSEFDGFDEVAKRFGSHSVTPYMYKGGCYALPITEDFPVLFYRTDIFEELGLTPPKTWKEFYKVISVLQRNNMSAGVPNMPSDSQMATNNNIYAMLLYQMGGSFYNDDFSATAFDTVTAVEAFKMWTGFYARYGLPYQYDFYNRFRTGEMPMGIDNYTLINTLAVGAPEIKGLWNISCVPGTEDESGNINNCTYAAGMAAVMFKKSDNKENTFKFLDWFTREDIQTAYGLQLESLLGASGRYNTANSGAFGQLPWSAKELKILNEQRNSVFALPQVPGNYYVDRNLMNAFRAVVFNNKNPREVLLDYNKEINEELLRKRLEFEKKNGGEVSD